MEPGPDSGRELPPERKREVGPGSRLSVGRALTAGEGRSLAVLISGSIPQTRDYTTLPGHHVFREIADTLTHHGIAVLRLDEQGHGGRHGQLAVCRCGGRFVR